MTTAYSLIQELRNKQRAYIDSLPKPDTGGDIGGKILSGLAGVLGTTVGLPWLGGVVSGLGVPGAVAAGEALTSAGSLGGVNGWWNAYQVGNESFNTGRVGDSIATVAGSSLKDAATLEATKFAKAKLTEKWIADNKMEKEYMVGPTGDAVKRERTVTEALELEAAKIEADRKRAQATLDSKPELNNYMYIGQDGKLVPDPAKLNMYQMMMLGKQTTKQIETGLKTLDANWIKAKAAAASSLDKELKAKLGWDAKKATYKTQLDPVVMSDLKDKWTQYEFDRINGAKVVQPVLINTNNPLDTMWKGPAYTVNYQPLYPYQQSRDNFTLALGQQGALSPAAPQSPLAPTPTTPDAASPTMVADPAIVKKINEIKSTYTPLQIKTFLKQKGLNPSIYGY